MSSSWKETLAAVAPTLATALGGPLAGTAVAIIGRKLLGVDNASEDDIAAALIGADPSELLKLKDADHQFKKDMKALNVQDRNSARKLAIDTTILPQVLLSSIYTTGYFWLMAMLISGDVSIPADISGMVMALIGVMTAAQAQIMNFWFGSSSGSKEKTSKLGGK
tara:strand:- start:6649 stop:7143 length:495 start_codon:yes stop_codon:yes gene_type:complete